MTQSNTQRGESWFGAILIAFGLLLLWLLGRGGTFRRSTEVESFIVYEPGEFGEPVFDSRSTHRPAPPYISPLPQPAGSPVCPAGYKLWTDINTGYQCSPPGGFPA